MQWDDTPHAGFTKAEAKPWMKVHDDHTEWNVASQKDSPESVLSFWKDMLAFRKKNLGCVSCN
jgi:oligo-1,6-glucosidase